MAGKGYNISIGSDTSEAEKGIRKGVIEPLEDVSKVLDDVNKDANETGDKLEDSMQDAQKRTESLANEIGDLSAKINDAGSSGRKFGGDIQDGVDSAKDGMSELKDESQQTAREAAASFDGSAESIVDMFQEVAANAFAGFGPAGAIAGLALAAGIGLGVKGFEDNKVAAEDLKKKITDLSQVMIEYGGNVGEVPLDYFLEQLKALSEQSDDSKASLNDIFDVSKTGAATIEELASAVASTGGNTEDLVDRLNEQLDVTKALEHNNAWNFELAGQYRDQAQQLREVIAAVEGQTEAVEKAKQVEQAAIEAGIPQMQLRLDMQNMINDAYDEAAGSVDNYVNSETGAFNAEAYIAEMQKKEKALRDYQKTLATSGLSEEAKAFLNEQGAEAAQLMLDGYKTGDSATKEELNRIWTEAGKEGSGAADKQIKDTFKTPYEARVALELEAKKAEKEIQDLINKPRMIDVQVRYVNKEGEVVD